MYSTPCPVFATLRGAAPITRLHLASPKRAMGSERHFVRPSCPHRMGIFCWQEGNRATRFMGFAHARMAPAPRPDRLRSKVKWRR